MITTNGKQRLLSLDILRGLDLACLVLIQPILYTWIDVAQPPAGSLLDGLRGQLEHVPWQGFCFWDIIMPLFMFMSGITIPFSMSKYKSGREPADIRFWRRLLKRFVVLWVVGMFCQGNLMLLDLHQLKPYSNTLQSIAVGYVCTCLLYVFCSLGTQIMAVVALMAIYVGVFALWGNMDFTIGSNICERIDEAVLGFHRDGIWWDGVWHIDDSYHYTWILSSLNFVATVWFGCLAGIILRSRREGMRKFRLLMLLAVGGIALGLAMHPVVPIIKHIWSTSMTLFSAGICMLLMALFYYVIDVKRLSSPTSRLAMALKYYGMNSLAAYTLAHVSFISVIDTFFCGFRQWTGDYYAVIQSVCTGIIIYLILRWMYKHDIFIKA